MKKRYFNPSVPYKVPGNNTVCTLNVPNLGKVGNLKGGAQYGLYLFVSSQTLLVKFSFNSRFACAGTAVKTRPLSLLKWEDGRRQKQFSWSQL
jgi:hypothetical protein